MPDSTYNRERGSQTIFSVVLLDHHCRSYEGIVLRTWKNRRRVVALGIVPKPTPGTRLEIVVVMVRNELVRPEVGSSSPIDLLRFGHLERPIMSKAGKDVRGAQHRATVTTCPSFKTTTTAKATRHSLLTLANALTSTDHAAEWYIHYYISPANGFDFITLLQIYLDRSTRRLLARLTYSQNYCTCSALKRIPIGEWTQRGSIQSCGPDFFLQRQSRCVLQNLNE